MTLTAYYGPAVGVYMENGTLVSNVTGGAVYNMATVEDVKSYFDAGFSFVLGDDADYMTYRSIGHAVGDNYEEKDSDGHYLNTDGIKLLELVQAYCEQYNVPYAKAKVLIKSLYLDGAMKGESTHTDEQIKSNISLMYEHLKTFPCFGGFIVCDEPRGYMAETYNYWYRYLVNDLGVYDDGYILYGALLGMHAAEVNVAGSSDDDTGYSKELGLTAEQYETYLQKYIDGLVGSGKDTLCFDYYPFKETITSHITGVTTKTSMLGQYFQNLEIFARLSEANGYKRSVCVQSVSFYNKTLYDEVAKNNLASYGKSYEYHGKVTQSMMTYQLYCALAYGYDQAAYFTYMQPFNQTDSEWFVESAYEWQLQSDGSYKSVATDTYTAMKNANAEVLALSAKMSGYKWLGTAYSAGTTATGSVFGGTTSYASEVLSAVSSDYDAIVGCLKNGDGKNGFVVVNADDPRLNRATSVTLTFGSGYSSVSYYENGVKKTVRLTDGKVTLSVEAGKGLFVIPV